MLKVKISDIEFKNPILTASGTFGYGDEVKTLTDLSTLGGIVTKSVTLNPREGNPPPRIFETESGMLNSIGLANVGIDVYCEEKLPFLNNLDSKIIINIAGSSLNEYIEVLEKFFQKNREAATEIMLHVHQRGVGVCGIYAYDLAETKAMQVMNYARKYEHPLQVQLEKE